MQEDYFYTQKVAEDAVAEALKREAGTLEYAGLMLVDRNVVVSLYQTRSFVVPWEVRHDSGKKPARKQAEEMARRYLPHVRAAIKKGRVKVKVTADHVHLGFTGETDDKIIDFLYPLTIKKGGAS